MKKVNSILLISLVGLFLLCPSFSNAQKGSRKAKARTSPKVAVPQNGETNAKVKQQVSSTSELDGEPTEEEMKGAVLRTMQKSGGRQRADGSIAVDNAIAGMSVKIVEFEKLGKCSPAGYGAGYFCTYNVTNSLGAHSNEGNADGDRHARGVNVLMRLLNGGRDTINETVTARFMRSKAGWITSRD